MPILIGDKSVFAIESDITCAYESKHFKALGFFVVHVAGLCYGVHSPEAAMLGWAYGEVKERVVKRGTHVAPFATEANAGKIANAFRVAIYAANQDQEEFFGIPQPDFKRIVYDNNLNWDPGDETFDDSSYVLQFDVGDRVRLIAFKLGPNKEDYHHDPTTLRDLWLSAQEFYGILEQWRKAFEAEWMAAKKISERDDGAKNG
jgi:Immunity protein 42